MSKKDDRIAELEGLHEAALSTITDKLTKIAALEFKLSNSDANVRLYKRMYERVQEGQHDYIKLYRNAYHAQDNWALTAVLSWVMWMITLAFYFLS